MPDPRFERRARKDLAQLAQADADVILEAIVSLARTGVGDVRKLHAVNPPTWRLRVGRFRVIYRREGPEIVVVAIGDRRDVYR